MGIFVCSNMYSILKAATSMGSLRGSESCYTNSAARVLSQIVTWHICASFRGSRSDYTNSAAGHLLSTQFYQNLELGYKSNVEHLTLNIEHWCSIDRSVDQLCQIVLQFKEVSFSSSLSIYYLQMKTTTQSQLHL